MKLANLFKRDGHENKDIESGQVKAKRPIVEFLQSIATAVAICVFVYAVIAMPNQIEGDSMKPNFHNNEIILTSKITQWLGGTPFGKSIGLNYFRGDVIVFQKPIHADFIKRIVGLPGEKIKIKDGNIYINSRKLVENYLPFDTFSKEGDFLKNEEEKLIPDDNYFVLGDNRVNSHDSRYSDIGFIDRNWMKGKVVLRYWPLSLFGIVKGGESRLE